MAYDREVLAANLRARRAWLNLSRNEVCEKTGISTSTLYNVECGNGSPTLDTISALADFYEVRIETLLEPC